MSSNQGGEQVTGIAHDPPFLKGQAFGPPMVRTGTLRAQVREDGSVEVGTLALAPGPSQAGSILRGFITTRMRRAAKKHQDVQDMKDSIDLENPNVENFRSKPALGPLRTLYAANVVYSPTNDTTQQMS